MKNKRKMKIEVYPRKDHSYGIRLRSGNGRILGHEYNDKASAIKTAKAIKANIADAEIAEL